MAEEKNNKWVKIVGIIFLCVLAIGIIGNVLDDASESSSNNSTIALDENNDANENSIAQDAQKTNEVEHSNTNDNCIITVGNVCYKEPHIINRESARMSYQECKEQAGNWGIKNCYVSEDYWAGLVRECGGINNIPSVDDMYALATQLYGTGIKRCTLLSEANYNYIEVNGCEIDNNKQHIDEDSPFTKWIQNRLYPYPPQSGYEEEARKQWQFVILTGTEFKSDVVHAASFRPQGIRIISAPKSNNWEIDTWGMCVSRK